MSINDLSILPGGNGPSLSGSVTNPLAAAKSGGDQAAVVRAAKDFESVLVQKLMEEMKNTIPESGLTEDGASKQMQDLFWLYLGQNVGQQGGLGLWKQMVRQLRTPEAKAAGANVETLR